MIVKKKKLLESIRRLADGSSHSASVVVYVTLQQTAVEVAEFLQKSGISSVFYYAGM